MLTYPLVGSITMWSTEDIPDGYLVADGSAISRTLYSGLFSVIGTQFGHGDGSTTFNLPDLRGLFPRFKDNMAARDPDASTREPRLGSLPQNAGSKQGSEIAAHIHTWPDTYWRFSGLPGTVRKSAGRYLATSLTLGSGGSESRPINITIAGLIKY